MCEALIELMQPEIEEKVNEKVNQKIQNGMEGIEESILITSRLHTVILFPMCAICLHQVEIHIGANRKFLRVEPCLLCVSVCRMKKHQDHMRP